MDQPVPESRNRLLGKLPAADFALLAPHLKLVSLEHGAVLQEAGEPIEQVYFPHSGMISLLAVMREGEGIEAATIGREGVANVSAVLGNSPSAGRVVVQVAGHASQIAPARFRAAFQTSEVIRKLVGRYIDVQMALVLQTAGCNALHHVEQRLCRWLLQTHDRCDTNVFPLTQEFLARMLGVQRTSVTAIARTLQTDKLIHYRRGQIEILDRHGLEKRACECYEAVRRRTEEALG